MALSKEAKMTQEIRELREDLEIYRQEGQNPEHLYIGLFGRTGCGKTSLINSLKFCVSGSFRRGKWFPISCLEEQGGQTIFRVIASLANNISVIDNRGFDDITQEGTIEEIKAQMDGKRGYSTEVNWGKQRSAADRDICIEDRKQNSIGCAVLVFSARDNIFGDNDGLRKAVDFFKVQQGRSPVAVITNVDVANKKHVNKLAGNLQSAGICEIFKVANITNKKEELEVPYQHNLLSLLDRCMTDGNEAAVFKHHQQEDQNVREAKRRRANIKKTVGFTGATLGATIGMAAGGPFGAAVGVGLVAAGGGVAFIGSKWFY